MFKMVIVPETCSPREISERAAKNKHVCEIKFRDFFQFNLTDGHFGQVSVLMNLNFCCRWQKSQSDYEKP